MNEALSEFEPQLLIYNAGTDVLQGDKLGGLSLTEQVSSAVHYKFNISLSSLLFFFHASRFYLFRQ